MTTAADAVSDCPALRAGPLDQQVHDGQLRKATLGAFPQMGLAEARLAAGRIFEQLANDIDPREAERQRAAEAKAARARTFDVIARRFIADCQHLRSIRSTTGVLRPVIVEWEGRPLATIRRRDVIAFVDAVKATRGPAAAVRTQAAIRRVFGWAVEKDELEASPLFGMKPPAPIRPRERTLSDDEVRRLWIACDQRPLPFGRYVQLLLLTGCRRAELATMRWTDVDFAEKTIVIPGGRYKTTRPHLVALSRQALALLEGLPRFTGPFVFSTTGGEKAIGGFGWMKRNIDALLDPPIDYDLHDLRRTCRTGMARLRVADHVAAWVLGRSVGGIQRVYNLHGYLDEKRQALQLWADHVEAVVTGRRAKVVPLHREAQ